jgi:polyisoprenoid-binding protein YceI
MCLLTQQEEEVDDEFISKGGFMAQSVKSIFGGLVGSLLTVGLVATAQAGAAKYDAGSYDIDPMHSKVGFEVPHLVISTVEGAFRKYDGKLVLDQKFEKSSVEANIEIGSIDTGVAKRDDHLKSPDFFDVAKFPKMSFKSSAISGKPESFKLTGDLTIKGITKKVTFDAKYLGTVVDGYGNQKAAFDAKTKINRKDFGLTWNAMVEAGPTVGDDVTLSLRIQAGRPAPKK